MSRINSVESELTRRTHRANRALFSPAADAYFEPDLFDYPDRTIEDIYGEPMEDNGIEPDWNLQTVSEREPTWDPYFDLDPNNNLPQDSGHTENHKLKGKLKKDKRIDRQQEATITQVQTTNPSTETAKKPTTKRSQRLAKRIKEIPTPVSTEDKTQKPRGSEILLPIKRISTVSMGPSSDRLNLVHPPVRRDPGV